MVVPESRREIDLDCRIASEISMSGHDLALGRSATPAASTVAMKAKSRKA